MAPKAGAAVPPLPRIPAPGIEPQSALAKHGPGDAAAATIASAQYGVISTRQMAAVGLTRDAIRERRRRGLLHPCHRGVYLWGHRATTDRSELIAAALAVGEGAAASHSTAAYLRGYLSSLPSPHHFCVVGRHRRSRRGIVVHEIAALEVADVDRVDRVPVVSPAWALLGLAAVSDLPTTRRALNAAHASGFDQVELDSLLIRTEGLRGWRVLRQARDLEEGPGFSRQEAERRIWRLITKAGLPRPERNRNVAGFEVDLVWPEQRLIVEVDGYRFHSSRDQFEFDRMKWTELRAAGYEVMPVTWRQITRRPGWLIARVSETLNRVAVGP